VGLEVDKVVTEYSEWKLALTRASDCKWPMRWGPNANQPTIYHYQFLNCIPVDCRSTAVIIISVYSCTLHHFGLITGTQKQWATWKNRSDLVLIEIIWLANYKIRPKCKLEPNQKKNQVISSKRLVWLAGKVCILTCSCQLDQIVWIKFGLRPDIWSDLEDHTKFWTDLKYRTERLSSLEKFMQIRSQTGVWSKDYIWSIFSSHPVCLLLLLVLHDPSPILVANVSSPKCVQCWSSV